MLIAALPPAQPPAKVLAGVRVTWPLARPETELAPDVAPGVYRLDPLVRVVSCDTIGTGPHLGPQVEVVGAR